MTARQLTVVCLLVLAACGEAPEQVLQRAAQLEESGAFAEAESLLKETLPRYADDAFGREMAFELDRLRRIRLDYPLTRDALWSQLEASVRDVTREEFERWVREGRFDVRTIDGEERFIGVSRSNLFWRYPDAAARRVSARTTDEFDRAVLNNARMIAAAAMREGKPYVLPKSFQVRMAVTLKPDAAPAGAVVRAWLPVPRTFPFQTNVSLVSSSSDVRLDDEMSPIRSAYMEQRAEQGAPLAFTIEYGYTHAGIRFALDPAKAVPYDRNDPEVNRFLAEAPHVVFSDRMREASDEIGGSETNPVLKARAFYRWIAENIRYSYALEYSTIRNIGEYCLTKGYGDCGQEALLFITLCRMNGIPARWQSGWFTFPGGKTIHDWTEIYIRPWGWVPVDPYMGIFAMQYMPSLTPDERTEVRDFYFGGLDQYRIAANSDHAQQVRPPKRTMRSDNVDFQRGELETGTTNLYFDTYSYRLDIQEVSAVY